MKRYFQILLWSLAWLIPASAAAASLWYCDWTMLGRGMAPLAGLRQWLAPLSAAYAILLVLTVYAGLRREGD